MNLQGVSSQTPVVQPSLFVSHAKQYWPGWVFKPAAVGMLVGQALNRWDITAGFAGAGLITLHVLSYFLLKPEAIMTPEAVTAYENQNAANIVNLNMADKATQQIEAIAADLAQRAEEGRSQIQETEQMVRGQVKSFHDIGEGERREATELEADLTQLKQMGANMADELRAESKDRHDLAESNAFLEKMIAEGSAFLKSVGDDD